jgi:hypothetical protein
MCRCQCLAFSAAATEGAVKREQEQGSIQTKTDARTLAYIMAALYSGLLNYKMTEMPEEEIKKIWGEGVQLIVSREGDKVIVRFIQDISCFSSN